MKKFEKLSRAEMKNAKGGDMPAACTISCWNQWQGIFYGVTIAPNCEFNYITQCQGHYGWELTNYTTCNCAGGSHPA